MAVVACVRQFPESLSEIGHVFNLDRFADFGKGRLALLLEELR
jgi:hypothetical protein